MHFVSCVTTTPISKQCILPTNNLNWNVTFLSRSGVPHSLIQVLCCVNSLLWYSKKRKEEATSVYCMQDVHWSEINSTRITFSKIVSKCNLRKIFDLQHYFLLWNRTFKVALITKFGIWTVVYCSCLNWKVCHQCYSINFWTNNHRAL